MRNSKRFSKIKKELETEWIANSVKGRIKYNIVRYRKSHDSCYGRVGILIDGKQMISSGDMESRLYRWYDNFQLEEEKRINSGLIPTEVFYDAYFYYINHSIEESMKSSNALVRLFSIVDRRVGKRRLKDNKELFIQSIECLVPFYQLRYEEEQKS